MGYLQQAALTFSAINFAIFIGMGLYLFDRSVATGLSKAFMATFLLLCGLTLGLQQAFGCDGAARLGVCLLLLVVSAATFLTSAKTILRRPFTAIFSKDVPAHFVSTGPFRYVRHPFYTAYLLTFLASAIATDQWGATACFVAALGFYTRAAKLEENKFSRSSFSANYAEMKRTTGMFFPRLIAGKKEDL